MRKLYSLISLIFINIHVTGQSGRVGIGTDNPESILHLAEVNTTLDGSSGVFLTVQNKFPSGNFGFMSGIRFRSDGVTTPPDTRYKSAIFHRKTNLFGVGSLHFAVNGQTNDNSATLADTRMTIHSNGNIGIGTTEPSQPLSFSAVLGKKISLYPGTNGEAGFGVFGNELRIFSDYFGADITFGYDDYTSGFTENMRLRASGGNLLVRGSVTANSSFYTSDSRYKKNIQPIHKALERITQLQAYNYYWTDKEQDPSLQSGIIAQEVQKIFPELVRVDNKGYLSVNYVGLIPYLLQSIKEQQIKIDELSKDNDELQKVKANVEELRKLLDKLNLDGQD